MANKLLYPGKSVDFKNEESASASLLAMQLFAFPFIKSVFIASDFVTLTKTDDTEDWQDVIPLVKQFLKEYLEKGNVIINEEELPLRKTESSNEIHVDDGDVVKWIKELLKNYVKPAVGIDGVAAPTSPNNATTPAPKP